MPCQSQVLGLKAIGIQAASLTSLTSKEEAAEVNQLLDNSNSGRTSGHQLACLPGHHSSYGRRLCAIRFNGDSAAGN